MPIIITSKKTGFRRAGIAHPAEPTEHPDERFDADQLAALEADPMLIVERKPAKEDKAEKRKKD